MRAFVLVVLTVAVAGASLQERQLNDFEAFKLKHGKTYSNRAEETKRFAIFKDNLRSIEEHNARFEQGLTKYKQGVNKFSDWTEQEFKAFLTLHPKPTLNATINYVKKGIAVPDSIDWRDTQVTGIKDQGNCGSCWAFSITGSTEAAYYRKTNKLVPLSEQQLVDCTTDLNAGCDGGYLDESFPYVQEHGLESEEDYAYTGVDGTCQYDASKVVTKVDSYVRLTPKDEDALKEAVATIGPVSIGMDATWLTYYSSGIFETILCTDELDHGVLVVGYGSDETDDYWIVKNSWGTEWGEDGYFKLLRGDNECGVADDAVYPIIN